MKKHNVLFVYDGPLVRDNNNYYGIKLNNNLIERYSYFGDKVSFLMRCSTLPDFDKTKYSKISDPRFNFIEVPNFKSLKHYHKKIQAKKIINEAVKDHDVIIARLPSSNGAIAVKYALKYNKPLMVEVVSCTFDVYWNHSLLGKLIAYYKMYKQRSLIKRVAYVIYVTNEYLQKKYPTKGKNISCSNVELKQFDNEVLESRINKILNNNNRLKLATIGPVNFSYKGQGDVIKALSFLKRKGIFFDYYLIGPGSPRQLELLADKQDVLDQVKIIGTLTHDKVYDFLDNTDIYIHPSKAEGLPRALIEAMSRACPALGTNVAGIPELLTERCIFEPGNIKALVEKLQFINNQWLLEQARYNYNIALNYQISSIDAKRKSFYRMFSEEYNL